MDKSCSISGCDNTGRIARGYCRSHYRRFLKYGDPLGQWQPKQQQQCTVEGCGKDARSKTSALCKMHYHRQYRGGEVGDAAERMRKHRNPTCMIDGCEKPDKEVGYCAMHGARWRRHGDPLIVIPPSERDYNYGEEHHNWVGGNVKYQAAHTRIARRYGKASEHICVECGERARHWSYNHDDPDEKYAHDLSRNPVAYSDKPEHYSPRCVTCHKHFDLGRIEGTVRFDLIG